MRCTACDTSAAPHELAGGKCLKCLGLENTTLRLLLAHVVMAIENGQVINDPGGIVYRQLFGIKFLEHLKEVLHGVNTQSVPTLKTDTPGTLTQTPVCGSIAMRIDQHLGRDPSPGQQAGRVRV